MRAVFIAGLVVLLTAAMPLPLRGKPENPSPAALSSVPLTAKEVRKAEASAKTEADHLRPAAYYEAEARLTQAKLTDAEERVSYWSRQSWMVGRTKVPNPYTSAKSLAESYRAELENTIRLAAGHRKIAEELEGR